MYLWRKTISTRGRARRLRVDAFACRRGAGCSSGIVVRKHDVLDASSSSLGHAQQNVVVKGAVHASHEYGSMQMDEFGVKFNTLCRSDSHVAMVARRASRVLEQSLRSAVTHIWHCVSDHRADRTYFGCNEWQRSIA